MINLRGYIFSVKRPRPTSLKKPYLGSFHRHLSVVAVSLSNVPVMPTFHLFVLYSLSLRINPAEKYNIRRSAHLCYAIPVQCLWYPSRPSSCWWQSSSATANTFNRIHFPTKSPRHNRFTCKPTLTPPFRFFCRNVMREQCQLTDSACFFVLTMMTAIWTWIQRER